MCRTLVVVLLVLSGGRAWAGDFSGFYAGLNAGYASGRDRAAVEGSGRGEPRRSASDITPDLPPSAAGAVATVRRSGPPGSGHR